MAKTYYFGEYNKCFTYKDLKTVYDILCCDEETLATIVTMGYDGDEETGLNCDSFADYGCDMMDQIFDEIDDCGDEVTPQSHWNSFCDALKEDSYFGSCRLWHRALNIQNDNDADVDEAMFDSSVCTFLGMIESDGDDGRTSFHCAFETLWLNQFDEEPEELPTYTEARNWYFSQVDGVSQYFSKNFLTTD
jgi:hypothetical protein